MARLRRQGERRRQKSPPVGSLAAESAPRTSLSARTRRLIRSRAFRRSRRLPRRCATSCRPARATSCRSASARPATAPDTALGAGTNRKVPTCLRVIVSPTESMPKVAGPRNTLVPLCRSPHRTGRCIPCNAPTGRLPSSRLPDTLACPPIRRHSSSATRSPLRRCRGRSPLTRALRALQQPDDILESGASAFGGACRGSPRNAKVSPAISATTAAAATATNQVRRRRGAGVREDLVGRPLSSSVSPSVRSRHRSPAARSVASICSSLIVVSQQGAQSGAGIEQR